MRRMASKFNPGESIPKPAPREKTARKPLRRISLKRQKEIKLYKKWQLDVIRADRGRCVKCGAAAHEFPPHHIKRKSVYPELKFDICNGVCVCTKCHRWFHSHPKREKIWLLHNRPEQHAYLYPEGREE